MIKMMKNETSMSMYKIQVKMPNKFRALGRVAVT